MNLGMTCPHCGERMGPRGGEVLTLGKLSINTDTMELWVGSEPRRLEPKCFRILAGMIRQPGVRFSDSDLLNVCDDWGNGGGTAALHVAISKIRACVGDAVTITPTTRGRLPAWQSESYRGYVLRERKLVS